MSINLITIAPGVTYVTSSWTMMNNLTMVYEPSSKSELTQGLTRTFSKLVAHLIMHQINCSHHFSRAYILTSGVLQTA